MLRQYVWTWYWFGEALGDGGNLLGGALGDVFSAAVAALGAEKVRS